jgi:hypothetical protein
MGADPGDYSIDPDELDEIVGEPEKTETALETLTADLEAWTNGMTACRTALAGLRAAARLAHGNYTGAVNANLSLWRQVRRGSTSGAAASTSSTRSPRWAS